MLTGDGVARPSRGLNDLDSDDEDLDIQNKKSYEVHISGELKNVELLVVTDTKISRDFIQVYLDIKEEVGQVTEATETAPTDDNEEALKSVRTIAKLSQIAPQICHCDFSNEPTSDFVNQVAEKLMSKFPSPNLSVIVLTSKNVSQYQNSNDDIGTVPEVVTKWLKTSKWPTSRLKPDDRLELPNIVGGLSAAILTRAEFTSKPGCLLVSYTDVDTSDSLTLKGFLQTFFKLGEVENLSLVPVSTQVSTSRLKTLFERQERGQIFM